ncbi:MAG: hypothetical protein ACE5JG_13705 [Planctomycetota bacterium]
MRCEPGRLVPILALVLLGAPPDGLAGAAVGAPHRAAGRRLEASGPVTLGEFAVAVAEGLGLPEPEGGFTPESAAWSLLQRKGVRVRGELASALVESDVIRVLNGLGYRIRTSTPSRLVTRGRLEIVLETFIAAAPQRPASPEDRPR